MPGVHYSHQNELAWLYIGACVGRRRVGAQWIVSLSGAKIMASALRCGGKVTMYTIGGPSLSTVRTLTSTQCTMMMARRKRWLLLLHLTGTRSVNLGPNLRHVTMLGRTVFAAANAACIAIANAPFRPDVQQFIVEQHE